MARRDCRIYSQRGVQAVSQPSNPSFIGPGLSFKGELHAQEDLIVQGRIEGSIKHAGHLTIGQQGNVKANINAKRITVEGAVEGDLLASEAVNVLATAKVRGNIFSPTVTLVEGARFTGSIDMEGVRAARPEGAAAQAEKPAVAPHPAQKQSA